MKERQDHPEAPRSRAEKIRRAVFSLLCGAIFLGNAHAYPRQEEKEKSGVKTSSLLIIPVVFYTPETKLAGGVGGIYAFRPGASDAKTRPSTFYFAAIYTQRKQFQVSLTPEVYLRNEKYFLSGKFLLEKYPNKFFGIGNETPDSTEEDYTLRTASFDLSAQKRLFPGRRLYLGLKYQFENYRMLKVETGGLLSGREIVGSRGGTISGLGFIVRWDTRDNVFSPFSGDYWQLQTIFHGSLLGSDYGFTNVRADLRKYFPVMARHVIAVQGVVNVVPGEAPFHKLAKLGGEEIMRGYYSGRYRDKAMVALQAEYRLPVWRWLGAVGFAGLGEVADRLGGFRFSGFKSSVGAGLRFILNKRERTLIRLDFGWGRGTSGMYFTAGEAF